MPFIFLITVSSVIFSYVLATPFNLLCEKPMKNFIDLILLPRNSIFKKNKDADDEDSEEESEDENEFEVKLDTNINKSILTSTMDGSSFVETKKKKKECIIP